MMTQISRRRFLKLAAGGVAILGLPPAMAVYAYNIEPYNVELTYLDVVLPNLAPQFDGIKIMQVSDFHLGEWITVDHMLSIVKQVNSLAPDIIVLTGDIFGVRHRGTPREVIQVLSAFSAPEGVFAILGNRDYEAGDVIVPNTINAAKNVQLLMNANVAIRRQDAVLYIGGLDDALNGKPDLDKTLNGIPPASAVILLAHEPDYADTASLDNRIGLQLSGHSHGGQIRLLGKAPVLPDMGQKYDMGLYKVGNMTLYTNRGVGMTAPFLRFNCRPEITLITLRSS